MDALARGREADAPRSRRLKAGTLIIREYQGERHEVTVANDGFIWHEKTYPSLSMIAREITGTSWNGPRFFGVRMAERAKIGSEVAPIENPLAAAKPKPQPKVRHRRSRIILEGRL